MQLLMLHSVHKVPWYHDHKTLMQICQHKLWSTYSEKSKSAKELEKSIHKEFIEHVNQMSLHHMFLVITSYSAPRHTLIILRILLDEGNHCHSIICWCKPAKKVGIIGSCSPFNFSCQDAVKETTPIDPTRQRRFLQLGRLYQPLFSIFIASLVPLG